MVDPLEKIQECDVCKRLYEGRWYTPTPEERRVNYLKGREYVTALCTECLPLPFTLMRLDEAKRERGKDERRV